MKVAETVTFSRSSAGPVRALLVMLLVVPWLWPFNSGSMPSVTRRLVVVSCGALLTVLLLAAGRGTWNTVLVHARQFAAVPWPQLQ